MPRDSAPAKTRETRDPRQGGRRAASVAPPALSPDPSPSPTLARLEALGQKMGLHALAATPDPIVVAEALVAHMPEVAALVVFALEEEVEPFKSGGGVTAAHLDGIIGLLEKLCDELGTIAAQRAPTVGEAAPR